MNEELQVTLNDALIGVIESAATAKDFILAETPEVINQILMWNMAVSIIVTIVGIAMLITIVKLYPVIKAEFEKSHSEENEFVSTGGLIGGVLFSVLGTFMTFNLTWLQILIAPKLYLLEYAASLVR